MKVTLLEQPNLLKNNLTPIFVSKINLDFYCIHPRNFTNRDIYVNQLKKNIENLNYTFNVFDGVEKKSFQIEKDILGNEIINFEFNNKREKIVFDTTRHKDSKNRKIYEGEIACMLSHYLLWDKLKNSDKEAHFILEDDAEIKMDKEQFKILLNNLPDFNTFDICYFNNTQIHNVKKDINKHYYEISEGIFNGTYGYLLSKRGLKKLLDNFTLYCVADGILGRLINEKKLKPISSNEKPISIVENISSTIWT
jgi:GR25 family glycosyltransferase involved in LPS biosynthesis